jgi:hypothetical protein
MVHNINMNDRWILSSRGALIPVYGTDELSEDDYGSEYVQKTIEDLSSHICSMVGYPKICHVPPWNLIQGEHYQYWYTCQGNEVRYGCGTYVRQEDSIFSAGNSGPLLFKASCPGTRMTFYDRIPYKTYLGVRYA